MNSGKINLKKKLTRTFAIVFCAIVLINIAFIIYLGFTNEKTYLINSGKQDVFYILDDNIEVNQHLNFSKDIRSVEVLAATYTKTDCSGTYKADVIDKNTNKILASSRVELKNIEDNSFIAFDFDKAVPSKNKDIILRISAENTSNNKVSLYANDAHSENMYSTKDNVKLDSSIIFKITAHSFMNDCKFILYLDILLCIFIVLFLLLYKFNVSKTIKVKFLSFLISIKENKNKIFKVMAIGLVIIILSFAIESIFESIQYNNMPNKGENGYLDNTILQNSDFVLNENNMLVSNKDNAVLEVRGQYIKKLRIQLDNEKYQPLIISNSVKSMNTEDQRGNIYHWNYNKDIYRYTYNVSDDASNIRILAPGKGTIIKNIEYDNTKTFNIYRVIFYSAVGIILLTIILFIRSKKIKIEILFLVISLTLGGIVATCVPTTVYSTFDEQIHYRWVLSEFSYNKDKITQTDIMQYNMRLPNIYDIKEQGKINNDNNQNNKSYIDDKNINKTDSILPSYTNLGHLPASIMIFLGKIFKLPYNMIFILGRLINVLIYSFVIYFAIKKLKSGKIILAVVALFPTLLLLSATYNYDWWISCFVMFGVAFFIGELQDKDNLLTLKNAIIMIGAFVIGFGPKAIYFPMILLLLLLGREKFKDIKAYKLFRIATIASSAVVLISFLIPFLIGDVGGSDIRGGSGVNSSEQIKFILTNPFEYASILFNFIKEYLSLEAASGFITTFGYIGNFTCFLPYLCILIIAMFTDRNECDKNVCNLKNKIFFLIIYVITVVLVCTALYVSFTTVGSQTIAGVSARYLLPLVFPFLAFMGPYRIKNNINVKLYSITMLSIPTVLNLTGIWNNVIKLYF